MGDIKITVGDIKITIDASSLSQLGFKRLGGIFTYRGKGYYVDYNNLTPITKAYMLWTDNTLGLTLERFLDLMMSEPVAQESNNEH